MTLKSGRQLLLLVIPPARLVPSTSAQGIPPVEGPDISSGLIPLPIDAQTMSMASGKFRRGYIQSWNFVIERKLPLELVGSAYHSLQMTLDRRFARGLFVKGSYTFSKGINSTAESSGSLSFNTPDQQNRNRALAPWLHGGALSYVLRDWQSTPFTVTAAAASLNAPANTETADQVKSEVVKPGGIGIGNPWFDPTAFQSVTAVRFGNTGRNILRGPGVVNVDAGLFRSVPLTERFTWQFRAEAFTLSNTPHFDNPAANASTLTNFGTFTSAQQDQRVLRFALRMFF